MSEMDKIFRRKLHDHASGLPDGLWDRIESELGDKKERKGLIFWFLGLGLMTLAVAGGWFTFEYYKMKAGDTVIHEINKEEVVASSLTKTKLIESELEAIQTDENQASEVIQEERTSHQSSALPNDQNNSNEASVNLSNENQESKEQVEVENAELEVALNQDKGISLLRSLDLPKGNIDLNPKVFPDPIGCPTFASRPTPNLFFEAYYKPFYAYKVLSANAPEIGEGYLNQRRDTESTLYSWSAGANIGWISEYNVGLKAGLEYEVINERFRYIDPDAIRNQTIITIDTIFNTDGSFVINSDTSVVEVVGTEVQQIANHHRMLSIPIHALYYLEAGKFDFELSGGPIFNLIYGNRGKIVDPSNDDRWFTKGESGSYDVYRDRLLVSFSFSANMLYSLNENIQLYVRPDFKYHPTSLARNSAPFAQNYLNMGVAVGARYYFSGNPNY